MPRRIFKIDEFYGIDQSRGENALHAGMSPDACNMDTESGSLKVAKGYVKHIDKPVPGKGDVHRLIRYKRREGDQFVVVAGNEIYAYKNDDWALIHTYPDEIVNGKFGFAQAQINSVDYLIIGCGEYPLIKYDGTDVTPFGSTQMLSDMPVLYLVTYRSRLFAAGNPEHPNRLYWSQLPGGSRSVEDWRPAEASPNVEGGHAEVGNMSSDPIIALAALPNQILIFKRHSIYRLLGDRPGNFIIEEVDGKAERLAFTSIVQNGSALYYLTDGGMIGFNGVNAQIMPDARRIGAFLKGVTTEDTRGALNRDKLYFSARSADGAEEAMVVYDLMRGLYMIRRGFAIRDLCAWDGKLFLINNMRFVYRFGEGDTYDGAPINAWWKTPTTDLFDKGSVKAMRELYLRGEGGKAGDALIVDVTVGRNTAAHRLLLPSVITDVLEVPLKNEGRTFSLRFYNEAGSYFSLDCGIELGFEQWRRVE